MATDIFEGLSIPEVQQAPEVESDIFEGLSIPEQATPAPAPVAEPSDIFSGLAIPEQAEPTPTVSPAEFQGAMGLDDDDPYAPSNIFSPQTRDITTDAAEVAVPPVQDGGVSLEEPVEEVSPGRDALDIQRDRVIAAKGTKEYTKELRLYEKMQEGQLIAQEAAEFKRTRGRREKVGKELILMGEGIVSGATFGIGGALLDKLEEASGGEISAESSKEQFIEGTSRLIGAVLTGGSLAKGMKELTKKFGLEGAKQMLAVRMATTGVQSGLNEAVNMIANGGDLKTASANFAQAMGASLFGMLPENAVPAGAMNFVAQVAADFVYDFSTDALLRRRFKDKSFKEWFLTEELPQLALSIGFAGEDLRDRVNFEATRQQVKAELLPKFLRDIEAKAPKPSPEVKAEMDDAKAEQLTEVERKKLAEMSTKEGEIDAGTKTAYNSLTRQLAQKIEESTATDSSGELGVAKREVEALTKPAKDWDAANRENDAALKQIVEDGKKSIPTELKKHLADADAEVKDALLKAGGKDAVMMKNLIKGASASAALEFKQARKRIKQALSYGRFKGGTSEKLLADYIDAKRTIEAEALQADRGKVLESRQGVTAESARKKLADMEANNRKVDMDNVKAAAEEYWGAMKNQLDQAFDAGLVGKEAYDFMVANHRNYSPRLFVDALDSAVGGKAGDLDSGIKALDEGSNKAMIQDPSILLEQVVSRTQSRILKNRANKELARFIGENPDAGIGRRISDPKHLKRGEELVTAFDGGKEVLVAMPRSMAESWNGTPPALKDSTARILQWGSGTKLLKTLATGINPEFVLSNLPRDIAFAWFNSKQYSNFMPKAALQMVADYAGVIKDAATKSGSYADYVKEGGGMDYLSSQGKLVSNDGIGGKGALKKAAGTIFDILGYLGETSEIATRLAVRNRAMKNGLSSVEATATARGMLDFAQGGQTVKALDNVVPYLNAAVQGTRGTLRSITTDPGGATVKAAQLIAMGFAQAFAANATDDEAYESISDREKATKWIIPIGLKSKDKDGNTRHAYLTLAKDQGQQIFSALGQSIADAMAGKPWSEQLVESMTQLIPVEFANTLPPIMNAALAYFGNYDTWSKRGVWNSYADVSPSMERNLTTPEMATGISDIAKQMGVEISPERLSTATSKMIPMSNPIVSGIVQGTNNLSEEDHKTLIDQVKSIPFARRVLRFSYPSNPSDKQLKDAERFGINPAGKTQSALRTEIAEAKRAQGDFRQTNNLKADEVMRSSATTSQDFRAWLLENVTSREERMRLWMRERAKHPERISGPYETRRSTRRRRRKR
jgi:hypothetical protein